MDVPIETKEKLVTACRILDKAGVLDDFGHFSVRCGDGNQMLMNPAMAPGQVSVEDLLLLDLNGAKIAGEKRIEREMVLHLAIYRRRPDVMAIAHTHSPMVVTLSIAGIKLKAVENMGAVIFPSEVPLYDRYGLVLDFDQANEVAEMMGSNNIIVLRGHGNIVAGASIEETCMTAFYTERCAGFQYRAVLIGGAFPFPEKNRKKMRKDFSDVKTMKRSWNYFEGMLGNAKRGCGPPNQGDGK
jgi:ribulose-5-phosphate 4-epimerase/fuculose-1-phosphate aldolase